MNGKKKSVKADLSTPDSSLKGKDWRITEGAAFRVADMIRRGNSISTIADLLFGHHSPKYHERVQSLIHHALRKRLLIFNPPVNEDLQLKLAECFDNQIHFHIVNNDHIAHIEDASTEEVFRSDVVCRKAAILVAQRIEALLLDKSKTSIVIATAGGLAVSRVVRLLDEEKLIPDEALPQRLLFISLNSASVPTDYRKIVDVTSHPVSKGGGRMRV